MEILFKQESKSMPLAERLGIESCMLKLISLREDRSNITKQRHYHSAVEIHIITKGAQKYDIGGKQILVEAGEFLMIMPDTDHIVLGEKQGTQKYAIVFGVAKESPAQVAVSSARNYIYAPLPDEIKINMEKIISEKNEKKPYFSAIISNRLEECLLCFLRILGAKEDVTHLVIRDGPLGCAGSAFYEMTTLQTVSMPDSLRTISTGAFGCCTALTTVTFGNNSKLKYIGGSAFAVSGLRYITIPASVVRIEAFAFRNCTSLATVTFKNTSGWYWVRNDNTKHSIPASAMSTSAAAINALTNTYSVVAWYRE